MRLLLVRTYSLMDTNDLSKDFASREKELMDQVASLRSSVEKLSRGELKHKEILFTNARDYGKKGLVHFRSQTRL